MRSCKRRLYLAVPLVFAAQLAYGQAGGLPAETSAREAADAQLQNSLNAEAAARAAGDSQLQNNINAEAAVRGAADTGLRNSINDETAARALGEARLQGNIDSEAGARAAGDANLQTQIDQLRNNGGGGGGGTADVNCTTGGSVSQALATGATQINISGTCVESVNVDRDGVTLHGEPGATIRGPDADTNTLNVRGNRVTIEGLTVTGGRNGITGVGAANLTVRNCNAQSTGRTGIVYTNGSSGTVDGCIVQSNVRDGIAVDGAQATIINSTVTNNARNGVLIVNGATARVGLTDRNIGAGNSITQNASTGVTVAQGSIGTIAMNTITDNGTNSTLARFGIAVSLSTASISGGNTISRNAGTGVFAGTGASVLLGDLGPGLPTTVNTISANGNAASSGGVFVFLGSTMVVRDAVIEQNNGPGLAFSTRSTGQVISSTIRNNLNIGTNTGDGIRLLLGSSLLPATPATTISGNAGWGVQCQGTQSIAVNVFPGGPAISYSGNTLGDLTGTCNF